MFKSVMIKGHCHILLCPTTGSNPKASVSSGFNPIDVQDLDAPNRLATGSTRGRSATYGISRDWTMSAKEIDTTTNTR